jgi:hypothetical protein
MPYFLRTHIHYRKRYTYTDTGTDTMGSLLWLCRVVYEWLCGGWNGNGYHRNKT